LCDPGHVNRGPQLPHGPAASPWGLHGITSNATRRWVARCAPESFGTDGSVSPDAATARRVEAIPASIIQVFNRRVTEPHLGNEKLVLRWAIADHPWSGEADGAAVRIAMTVAERAGGDRAAEERRNVIRWLRPEFQQPGAAAAQTLSLGLNVVAPEEIDLAAAKWPTTLSDRITAVREALTRSDEAVGVEEVARRFKGSRRIDVEAILESLSAIGIAVALDAGKGKRWMRARSAA